MIYIKTLQYSVAASAKDYEIGSLEAPEGYKLTILELGFKLPADSWVYSYIGEFKVDEIHGSYATTIPRRIIVNREVPSGIKFKITSTAITGGQTTILVVYDKSTI